MFDYSSIMSKRTRNTSELTKNSTRDIFFRKVENIVGDFRNPKKSSRNKSKHDLEFTKDVNEFLRKKTPVKFEKKDKLIKEINTFS